MSEAVFIRSYADPTAVPSDGPPQIAMLGRSNAGKSTLINSLAQNKTLAKTSATPGRTQLINLFGFGKEFVLVDLPGYGYAKGSHEKTEAFQKLVLGYLEEAQQLAGAVLITDARLKLTESDQEMLRALQQAEIPVILVANKLDKLSRSEQVNLSRELTRLYPEVAVVGHSSVSGDGRGVLLDAIRKLAHSHKG